MALRVEHITLKNFRNYEGLELDTPKPLTILVGENAMGKTNLMEAIQLLTAFTSFRHAPASALIQQNKEWATITLEALGGNRQLTLETIIEPASRQYRLNGKPKRPADLRGLIPSVAFTPDDLELAKGAMGTRRHSLDALGAQLSAGYSQVVKDYEKVIRHKNKLLKEENDPVMVSALNELIITVGSQLQSFRASLFSKLAPHIETTYKRIASQKEELQASYIPQWAKGSSEEWDREVSQLTREEIRQKLEEALQQQEAEEWRRRRALVGPQSDELVFTIEDREIGQFGSQGQQRSMVLAWKLAEAALIEEMKNEKPILLLDDVMSELDGSRREALVEYIEGGAQTFITTANLAYFSEAMTSQASIVSLPIQK